jgi:hypothetical protein
MIISCNNEDWRIERLKDFILHLPKNIDNSILKIEDQKGTLIIFWIKKPQQKLLDKINLIWERKFNELACNVFHL